MVQTASSIIHFESFRNGRKKRNCETEWLDKREIYLYIWSYPFPRRTLCGASWILLQTVFSFFLRLVVSSSATDVSGPVFRDVDALRQPLNVIGQINIPAGQELLIEPGRAGDFSGMVQVPYLWTLAGYRNGGRLHHLHRSGYCAGWHGLRFYDINTQPDSSRLVYCKITYGKSSSVNTAGDDKNGGAIFCSNSES